MSGKLSRRGMVAGLLAAGAMGAWIAWTEVAHAQTGASSARQTVPGSAGAPAMSADLRILRRQVTATGADAGPATPGMVLHLERRQDAGGWKTSLGLTDIDRPTVHSGRGLVQLDHPFLVARMEFDDEGGEPRMYDATGRRVQMAGERERKMLGLASSLRNRTWDADVLGSRTPPGRPDSGSRRLTAGLTAEAGGRDNRRQQLEQRYGRPTGRVGRLDRFASAAGGTTEEVLVDPDAELPVEVNIVEDGALMSRVQVSYESNSTVGFVRRHVRSEQVADRASGMRMVTDVELANLTVTAGGGR